MSLQGNIDTGIAFMNLVEKIHQLGLLQYIHKQCIDYKSTVDQYIEYKYKLAYRQKKKDES